MNVCVITGKIVESYDLRLSEDKKDVCMTSVIEVLGRKTQNLFVYVVCYGKTNCYRMANLGKPGNSVTIRGSLQRMTSERSNNKNWAKEGNIYIRAEEVMFSDPVTDDANMKLAIEQYKERKKARLNNKAGETVDDGETVELSQFVAGVI